MSKQTRSYAPGSAPDVVARLRQAIEANETTRMLLDQGAQTAAIKLHLEHQDDHLKRLIADLESIERGAAQTLQQARATEGPRDTKPIASYEQIAFGVYLRAIMLEESPTRIDASSSSIHGSSASGSGASSSISSLS